MSPRSLLALPVLSLLLIVACSVVTPKTQTFPVTEPDPVVVQPLVTAPAYSEDDLACLQTNIFFEARNQSTEGKAAVGLVTVTRTRIEGYPDTICGVVQQAKARHGVVLRNRCQFSWYCDGKPDVPNLKDTLEAEQWIISGEVAKAVLSGQVTDFLGNSTHYHATYCKPGWSRARRMRYVARVGDHIFYRDVKRALKSA